MNHWVEFYEHVLGMINIVHFGDDQIQTEYSALMSKVMADGAARSSSRSTSRPRASARARSRSTSTSTAAPASSTSPSRRKTSCAPSRRCRVAAIAFLDTPEAYYEEVEGRVGEIAEDYDDLKRLRILADRDEDGYLLQIFTKTAQDRPTLFFEVIERHGATTFGEGNFKALFESIEREQALRGNL